MLHRTFIKIPWWVKRLFPKYTWSMPPGSKTIYLTFDDGPHPEITPFVIEELKKYDAKATFFLIGDNVQRYPGIVQTIIASGHSIGNHTQHHMNGWKTTSEIYLNDVTEAAKCIDSDLFRPPYGRIKKEQAKGIANALGNSNARIIMWDVLSADFDKEITKETCLDNVLRHATDGSIVVFHDSEKAFPHLSYVLPKALEVWRVKGYRFERL